MNLLGLPTDATYATLNAEQLEELARLYVGWIHALNFESEACGQCSTGRERLFVLIRLHKIRRIIGPDRFKLVRADIDRQWLDTWDSDVTAVREKYEYYLTNGGMAALGLKR